MRKTQLDRMIELALEVSDWEYDLYTSIRACHEKKPLKYRSEWCDGFKRNNPDMYPLPVFGKEPASRGYLEWEIVAGRTVRITLYDGDNFGGRRRGRRCTFTVYKVPKSILLPYVKKELWAVARDAEEKEEAQRRSDRCTDIYKKMMDEAKGIDHR